MLSECEIWSILSIVFAGNMLSCKLVLNIVKPLLLFWLLYFFAGVGGQRVPGMFGWLQ